MTKVPGSKRIHTISRILSILLLIGIVLVVLDGIGDMLFHFPQKVSFTHKPGAGGQHVSKRVVVVVVDGLSVRGLRDMPILRAFGKRGVLTRLRVEEPSYSRVGYAVLGTGAKPEVSGVSSNSVTGRIGLDTIFARAGAAGLRTGFVGYAWWMEAYGEDIAVAALDSGWKKGYPGFQNPPAAKPIPKGFRRRLLHKGRYIELKEDWDSYILRHKIYDGFGDHPDTPAHEDDLRGDEAVRMLQKDGVKLLYVHLQSPDDQGHKTGSTDSPGYRKACRVVDRNIQKILKALDLKRDTLIVTADHGFTSGIKNAGHGGWEASAALVPLGMIGAHVKMGMEKAKPFSHLDIVPSLSVLLGLPFPTHNQGKPLWTYMKLPKSLQSLREKHYLRSQIRFYHAYAKHLGFSMKEHTKGTLEQQWQRVKRDFRFAKWWHQVKQTLLHFILAVGLLVLFIPLLFSRSIQSQIPIYGLVSWLFYEVLFHSLFWFRFKVYSLSGIDHGVRNALTMATLSGISLLILSIAIWMIPKWRPFYLEIFRAMFFGILVKSAVIAVVTGAGHLDFVPHGFWLFASLAVHLQTLGACFALLFVESFSGLLPKAK